MKRAILADESLYSHARVWGKSSNNLALAILMQAFDIPQCLPASG